MITMTDVGSAIITHQRLEILTSPKWGTNGTVALGVLLDRDGKPECWCLFWEWGGDWMGFGDEQRHNVDELDGWEPDAVDAAVAAAVEACPDCAEDMEWFSDWAAAARETLSTKENEEDAE